MDMKPGVKTSEFWISVLPFILLALKQFSGVELEQDIIANGVLGLFGVITAVVYIISRFRLKMRAIELKK